MPTLDTVALGARVREARRKAGLTQAQLAEAAGITDETVSRLERGKFAVAPETLVAVADALGAGLDGLVGRATGPSVAPKGSPIVAHAAKTLQSLSPSLQRVVLQLLRIMARSEERTRTPKARRTKPRRRRA